MKKHIGLFILTLLSLACITAVLLSCTATPTTTDNTENTSPMDVTTDTPSVDDLFFVSSEGDRNVQAMINEGILEDDTYYILAGIGTFTGKNLTVPATHDGKRVVAIREEAFSSCNNLTEVIIPGSIKLIGARAFFDCRNLTSVTIEDGVLTLAPDSSFGDAGGQFAGCTSLSTVSIPNSLLSSSGYTFAGCTALTFNEYDNALYLGNESNPYHLLISPKSKDIESCLIHPNTKVIEWYAFAYCTELTSVSIPDVTTIGNRAFQGCESLFSLVISDAQYIEIGAFESCPIKEASIPASALDSIPKTYLRSLDITSGTKIKRGSFADCALKKLTISDSITDFEDCYIGNVSSLECNEYGNAYYIGNLNDPYIALVKVKENGSECHVHENTKFIIAGAFYNYYNPFLTDITLSDGILNIGDNAFGASQFWNLNEYDNALYLGSETNPYLCLIRAKNENITECHIHESTKFIGNDAFYNCTSLTSVTVSDAVIYIGNSAFFGCSLTSITLPANLTNIREHTFSDCNAMTSIEIPAGVTSIGDSAFRDCRELETILFNGTLEEWNRIDKQNSWDDETGYYTVQCMDGRKRKIY